MESKEDATKLHKQVLIRVNAECDEGIAPVVIAFNEIDGVITSAYWQEFRKCIMTEKRSCYGNLSS